MACSITLAQIDGTGTLLRLKATDPAALDAQGHPIPQSFSAISGSATLTVHVAGTAHSYPLSNPSTTLIHGINDSSQGQVQAYWPSVMLVLNSNGNSVTVTAGQAVTIDLPAGWATAGGASLTAQPGLAVTNCVAAGTMLPAVTGPVHMAVGDQLTQINYSQVEPVYRNLAYGMQQFTATSSGPVTLSGDGYVTALNGATAYDTPMFTGTTQSWTPNGYPCLPNPVTIRVAWTCAIGDPTTTGFTLTSNQGDTIVHSGPADILTGTSRLKTYLVTAAGSFLAPSLRLQGNTTTATSINVFRVLPGDTDPTGASLWDPGFSSKLAGKYAIRFAAADGTNNPWGPIDQTDEPTPTQASIFNQLLNARYFHFHSIGPYPNADGAFSGITGVPIQVVTGDATPAPHGYREGQLITISTGPYYSPPGNLFPCWRPNPGSPYGNALQFPSPPAAGTMVDCGNDPKLNFAGAYTFELRFQHFSGTVPGAPQAMLSQSVGGSNDRFEVFRETDNTIKAYLVFTGGGSKTLNTSAVADALKHTVWIDCDGTRTTLCLDGFAQQSWPNAGMRSDSDGSVHLTIGARPDGTRPYAGIVDEVHGSKSSRYFTNGATPSTVPLAADPNTVALYHLDSVAAAAACYDVVGGSLGTLVGTPGLPANAGMPALAAGDVGFGQAIALPSLSQTMHQYTQAGLDFGVNQVATLRPPFTFELRFKLGDPTVTAGVDVYLLSISLGAPGSSTCYFLVALGHNIPQVFLTDSTNTFQGIGSAPAIADTAWHWLRVTYDGSTLAAYLDGNQIDRTTFNGLAVNTTAHFTIGNAYYGPLSGGQYTNGFYGEIDAVRISNTVRDAGNYVPPPAPFVPGPGTIFLAHFESIVPSGGTPDAGPFHLDGQLAGSTLPALVPSPWYVAPGSPTSVGNITLENNYQFMIHVVDANTFAFATDNAAGGTHLATQPGDYISASAGGAGMTGWNVFANETGGNGLITWNSRTMVPIRHKIALCNQLNAHLLLTVPVNATPAYMAWLMGYIGDLSTGLVPGLMCFLETGNEIWNTFFNDYKFMIDQASLSIAAGNPANLTTTDVGAAGAQYHAYLCHRNEQAAVAALEAIQPGRGAICKLMIGTQLVNPGNVLETRLNYAQAQGWLANVYGVLIAPYCNNGPYDATFAALYDSFTQAQLMSVTEAWADDMPETDVLRQNYAYLQTLPSIPKLCGYEGGWQNMGLPSAVSTTVEGARARAIARDPALYGCTMVRNKHWDPYLVFHTHFNLDQSPYQPNYALYQMQMWGIYNHYRDNTGRGDGVTGGSAYNNRSNPENLLQLESVPGQAYRDWNNLLAGAVATTLVVTGATTAAVGVPVSVTFTVNADYTGGILTLTNAGLTGSWSPTSLTFAAGLVMTANFTATAASPGTLSATSSPSLSTTPLAFTATASATTLAVTGSATGTVGVAVTITFTVNASYAGGTLTLTNPGLSGSWSPTSLTFSAALSMTATFTASAVSSGTLSATSSPGLTTTPLAFTASVAAATTFAISGPSSGYVGAAAPITYTVNGNYSAGVLTPTKATLTGAFSPSSLTFGAGPALTSSFTPSAAGSGTINATSSPALTPPANFPFTATAAPTGGLLYLDWFGWLGE